MTDKPENKIGWAAVSSLGLTLVVATAIGFTAGYYLDKWLNTSPWFTLILFVVGIVAGFWTIIKEVVLRKK